MVFFQIPALQRTNLNFSKCTPTRCTLQVVAVAEKLKIWYTIFSNPSGERTREMLIATANRFKARELDSAIGKLNEAFCVGGSEYGFDIRPFQSDPSRCEVTIFRDDGIRLTATIEARTDQAVVLAVAAGRLLDAGSFVNIRTDKITINQQIALATRLRRNKIDP